MLAAGSLVWQMRPPVRNGQEFTCSVVWQVHLLAPVDQAVVLRQRNVLPTFLQRLIVADAV
jgi:hypothetical protein